MHATPRSFSGQISLGKYGSPYLSFRNSHCMSHSATSSDVNKCVEVFFFSLTQPSCSQMNMLNSCFTQPLLPSQRALDLSALYGKKNDAFAQAFQISTEGTEH